MGRNVYDLHGEDGEQQGVDKILGEGLDKGLDEGVDKGLGEGLEGKGAFRRDLD